MGSSGTHSLKSFSTAGLPNWFRTAYKVLVASVFCLIALGGSVRLMNAGLACPDWPLCFGDVIPDFHPQVYFEFIHRALAGVIGLVTVAFHVLIFRSRLPSTVKRLAAVALVLLGTQIVFGGLTVLLQLHSKVVAAHLSMGTGFFALLFWIYLSLPQPMSEPSGFTADQGISVGLKMWTAFILAAVYGQIVLGGLVASHFASLVCIDFPTCHGEWFPTFSGIIGLHVIHRLGAYTLFTLIMLNWWWMNRTTSPSDLKQLSRRMAIVVGLQVVIGISNVVFLTPPLIAVTHLAVGTFLLSLAVRQAQTAFSLPSVVRQHESQVGRPVLIS